MIIIDKLLEKLEIEGKPIRVGLVGAGFAARGFALQLLTLQKGIKLVAVANRTVEHAKELLQENGFDQKKYSITDNAEFLCSSGDIDVIIEATGEVEFGAKVALSAIKNGKHIILINAELDGTLGPILKSYADKKGVIYSQADGDQPAKLMNLYREVKSLGFKPILLGNIKSLIDHYRTPETQANFARAHFQRPKHITSFADGTKISFEMATAANATGFKVDRRGMTGPSCARVEEAAKLFPIEKLLKRGWVDYILGAEPSFGVFVLGYSENPIRQKYMKVYKMGDGPVYTFYTPYHLSPLEAPLTVARAYLFKDAALAPTGKFCDVITIAKKDLKKGERLDGIGGFTCYGTIENSEVATKENLLPMGLSENCILRKDIPKDTAIKFSHVSLPQNRISDKLWKEQQSL
ncbi:Gfo/Idh/MocA family oxidoreductase [Candidatus Gottesmanbacteria bacterium]|nr:Gfo/Idh/MocA family oxidoreductase [Candidatus Gottesmanbacteria bacterium]